MPNPDGKETIDLDGETWKKVPGALGYEVSDFGRVRSWWTGRQNGYGRKPKIIKGAISSYGYRLVGIKYGDRRINRHVSNTVLRVFRGDPPAGMECCHNNGDKSDNRLSNLRWDTRLGNSHDRVKHGTLARGEKLPQSVLTEDSVRSIRKEHIPGVFGVKKLAKKYGVNASTIQDLIHRRTWKHVL